MSGARIFVTGIGMATPLALAREPSWDALVAGKRGIRPIRFFDTTGQRGTLGGVIDDLALPKNDPSAGVIWSRTSTLALTAAREAMTHAGIDPKKMRVGLVVGGTTGGMFETEAHLAALHVDPSRDDALLELLTHPLSATGDSLHATLGPFVRVRSLSTACSGGANAIIVAASWLLSGAVDVVVAGGSDGLCRLTLSGFNALAAVDPEPCRPFDRTRRGLNIGEGAGFVVLERSEHVARRSARVIAELAGWSLGSEAHHITNPEATGRTASRVIAAALDRAGIEPSTIDYVNAHGTGTPLNDPMETAALHRVFGAEIERIPVSSSKGQIGHTLAAAGGVEAAISALVLERQTIVPTIGLTEPDPACALQHVFERGRRARVRAVLTNSFGFGGMDSALVLTEPELGPPRTYVRRAVVVTGAATLTPAGLEALDAADASLGDRVPGKRIEADLASHLDVARARRLDRPARVQAIVVEQALKDAQLDPRGVRTGLVMGSCFGSMDASAAFMHRVFERGPRFASPADFPNLVPSSPVGHVSIYLGMEGPVIAAADYTTSGEGACTMAMELVESGAAEAVVGGAFEEESRIVERRQEVLHARSRNPEPRRPRAEGAGAVLFEAEDTARGRGAPILARVVEWISFRENGAAALGDLAPPKDAATAVVVMPRRDAKASALLATTSWRGITAHVCDGAGGEHEALGAIALAAATALLAKRAAREVLVFCAVPSRGYAVRLAAP
jgi:3-oxoacyl-[acyl-carrier-protein] synthase II